MRKRIERGLVIGAAGQVGGALVEALGDERAIPVVSPRWPDKGITLDLEQALRDPIALENRLLQRKADAVFYAAGFTRVDACEDDPGRAFRINRDASALIASLAQSRGMRFVYFSTEYVFDGRNGPYGEDDFPSPLSAYGRSKLEGEQAVLRSCPGALILRTTVVYGPEDQGKNFAYQVAEALKGRRPIQVPEDQFSNPTYNRDLASAAVTLTEKGVEGLVNVVTTELMSRYEFACRLAASLGSDGSLVAPIPTAALGQRAARPLRAGLRTANLASLLPGWIMRSIEEAVAHWLRNQRGRPFDYIGENMGAQENATRSDGAPKSRVPYQRDSMSSRG